MNVRSIGSFLAIAVLVIVVVLMWVPQDNAMPKHQEVVRWPSLVKMDEWFRAHDPQWDVAHVRGLYCWVDKPHGCQYGRPKTSEQYWDTDEEEVSSDNKLMRSFYPIFHHEYVLTNAQVNAEMDMMSRWEEAQGCDGNAQAMETIVYGGHATCEDPA